MLNPKTAVSSPHIQLHLDKKRLPFLWFVLLLLAAILLPDRVWNTLLVGFGGLFLIAYLWARLLAQGLHAERRLRFRWVSVGDQLHEQFTLINKGQLPALWVEILDFSNVPGYQPAIVRSVSGSSIDQWKETAVCQQRGQFRLGPWAIRSSDPFGIFTVTRHYPAHEEIIIHPPIHGNLSIPLPAGQSSGRVRARQKSWQATTNAASVRDYRPNDPLRWIHWPTSAHRGELFVREFDLDAAGDIWILLDMATAVQLGSGINSTEEHAVLLAASLAAKALSQNRAVGLAAYGQTPQIVPAGRGRGQQWKILRALALVNADGQHNLAQAITDLGRIARRGAAAIIITPTDQADWIPNLLALGQRGVQSHVTLLDRPSFGGTGSSEGLRQAVRQLGFQAHIVQQGDVGQPLQEQERRGFWEFKITPTGKAVAVRSPLDVGVKG
jgi:uncharacterized protein (DUF58 family)